MPSSSNASGHGYSAQASLSHFIRHEAGHVLLYWLLDRPLAGCVVTDKVGLTHPIRTDDTQELIMPHILVALAGMVMASEPEVIDELEGHLHEPGYFHENTDVRIVAEAMQSFDPAQRLPLLLQFRLLLSRLKTCRLSRPVGAPPRRVCRKTAPPPSISRKTAPFAEKNNQ